MSEKEEKKESALPIITEEKSDINKTVETSTQKVLDKFPEAQASEAVAQFNHFGATMLYNYFRALGEIVSKRNLVLSNTCTTAEYVRNDDPSKVLTVTAKIRINKSSYSLDTAITYTDKEPKEIN